MWYSFQSLSTASTTRTLEICFNAFIKIRNRPIVQQSLATSRNPTAIMQKDSLVVSFKTSTVFESKISSHVSCSYFNTQFCTSFWSMCYFSLQENLKQNHHYSLKYLENIEIQWFGHPGSFPLCYSDIWSVFPKSVCHSYWCSFSY